jgi:hypothetical protein
LNDIESHHDRPSGTRLYLWFSYVPLVLGLVVLTTATLVGYFSESDMALGFALAWFGFVPGFGLLMLSALFGFAGLMDTRHQENKIVLAFVIPMLFPALALGMLVSIM